MNYKDDDLLTAEDAKPLLDVTTDEGVIYMIKHEQLPGARKADPKKRTSVWLIPFKAIKAHPKYIAQKKRGNQAAKAN